MNYLYVIIEVLIMIGWVLIVLASIFLIYRSGEALVELWRNWCYREATSLSPNSRDSAGFNARSEQLMTVIEAQIDAGQEPTSLRDFERIQSLQTEVAEAVTAREKYQEERDAARALATRYREQRDMAEMQLDEEIRKREAAEEDLW